MKVNLKTLCLTLWSAVFSFLLLMNIHSYFYLRWKNLERSKIEQQPQQSLLSSSSLDSGNTNNQDALRNSWTNTATKTTAKNVFEFSEQPKLPVLRVENEKPQKISQKSSEIQSNYNLVGNTMSWKNFLDLPFNKNYLKRITPKQAEITKRISSYQPNQCPADMVRKLAQPRLPKAEFDWCLWALSPSGGRVEVGKSWGKLSSKREKERFDTNNCNAVKGGLNPSCDDSWGDIHISRWLNTSTNTFACERGKSSQVNCFRNDNSDLYCEMFNAQLNFAKVRKVSRGSGMTPSKKFDQDFLSTDCRSDISSYSDFSFPHLYSPKVSSDTCDVVYNGTLLLYSHDDIRNLGHTLNDIMNIWVMLWLAGIGRYADQVEMLNVDSFKLGHNFDDKPNTFFLPYWKSLKNILKGISFEGKTLCVKHLLVQNIPPRFFIWESWFTDMPCSFLGPSTLYQRWNLHVRAAYNLLSRPSNQFHRPKESQKKKIKILMIVRNEHSNMWGSQRTSRNYLNLPEAKEGFQRYEQDSNGAIEVIFQEMNQLSFEEQIQLISDTSIMVGAHGAGMASSMHMSVGSSFCCGIIEMYPQGEFSPIKGHGNMARKMGVYYDRVDIPSGRSAHNGFYIPVEELIAVVEKMVQQVRTQPSCIHPDVLNNPFLE